MRSVVILLLLVTAVEPAYHAQGDTKLSKQPFISVDQPFIFEFYPHGMYKLESSADGKEILHGAYSLFGNVLALDSNMEKPMTCRYSINYRPHAVQQWHHHVAAFPRGRDAREKCESSRRDD
jgi:hypothetical protein